MLVGVLADEDDPDLIHGALCRALRTQVTLSDETVDAIVDGSLEPARRLRIAERELEAYEARFSAAAATVLRDQLADELSPDGFLARHGPDQALHLLDAMFSISAVDGTIEDARAGRLRDAARGLGVDPQLVAFLFRRHDVRHASGDFVFDLKRPRYVIGRGETADIRLPDPQVADRHAELIRTGQGWEVVDLHSGRPTLLGGEPVTRAMFRPGDDLRVGPYALALDGNGESVVAFGMHAFASLSVRSLTRRIGQTLLLDDVSFTAFAGEVIAVVGPSGSGKTTLLSAITGVARADEGSVVFDGQDFHRLLAHDSTYVGIVPQEDVVHAELEVGESLQYAGQLRFPPGVSMATVGVEVDRVLTTLGIDHIRHKRIGDEARRGISGGQRKRVNLGQELLTQTTRVMFLDEPTSGLDPETAHDIVALIRKLADEGRIIFLVTHDVSPSLMALVDHLLILAPGGRLSWFGPPEEACAYFQTPTVNEVFRRIGEHEPQHWKDRYRASEAWRTYVGMRQQVLGMVETGGKQVPRAQGRWRDAWRRYPTLVRRYTKVKLRDTVGLAVLLGQAPVLGVAMALAFPQPDPSAMFMLALSSLWFGASDSVRELIADRTIWRREHRIGLTLGPYLLSKLTVLGALVLLQCAILSGICYLALGMGAYGFSYVALTAATALVGMVGVCLGLWMSAMFPTSEAAIASLPLVLIPQIVFGGLVVTVKKMGWLAVLMSYFMVTRYGFEMIIKTGKELCLPGSNGAATFDAEIRAPLFNLGFRTSDANDMGLSMPVLVLILVGFAAAFLLGSAVFTARSARQN